MKLLKKILITNVFILTIMLLSAINSNAFSCSLKGITTGDNVNVRSGAGTSYSVIYNIPKKSTNLTIKNTKLYNNSWYKVKLSNGKVGYMSKDFVSIKKNQILINSKKTTYSGYSGNYYCINTTGKKAKWTSSDKSIAKVSSEGKVTSLKSGKVTITVKANNKSSKSTLTVKTATVTLKEVPQEMMVNDSQQIIYSCSKSVKFISSNTEIATVTKDGYVTAHKNGKVKITVSSKSHSQDFEITVKKRTLKINIPSTTIFKGSRSIVTVIGATNNIKFKSSNTGVLTIDENGIITALSSGSAKITCTSGNLKKSLTITVKNGNSVNISNKKGTVSQGMTLYLKSTTQGVKWTSSDTSVATVKNGFVLGEKEGTVIISASTSKGSNDCLVTVTRPEAVRFVYTSQNTTYPGDEVKFYAITDLNRSDVKFKLTDPSGKESWITKTTKSTENERYIWTGAKTLSTAGEYKFEAYSKAENDSEWLTDASAQGTTFISSVSDKKTVSFTEKRASTELINNIAEQEGYAGTVYTDTLANNIPTVGYGRVIYAGSTFYNGMTKKEAYAFLVKTINESGYTSRMNKILIDNKIKFNQQQFDALVDFSYNLGPYCITNNDSLYNVLLNTYGSENNKNKAFANCYNAVIKKSKNASSKTLKKLAPGEEVTIVSSNTNWYKIQIDDNSYGFVAKTDLTKRTTNTKERNLNNVKMNTFAKAYLPYHHASGVCYKGLLYRRIDEVDMFFFGDYIRDGSSNKPKISYKCSSNSGFYI